jgi:asparagine synthase (glutamine-hydrolysing)
MSNLQKNIWLTFNGEIYNYKSLKNELAEFEFKSNTDTEVLLYAYEKWGIDCLRHFNGMWAFVIYDVKKKILFGSRDRFGVKPLYFTKNADFFAFNSEIKGLLAKPDIPRTINMNASTAYLRLGLESFGGESFFDAVSELEPAHYFIYDIEKKELAINRYYELPFYDVWETFNEKKAGEYINETRMQIINAVDLRLNADVTVGSCLSGGMDSSAIVCSINKLLKANSYNSIGPRQKVVTACYENLPIDESKWAKIAADHINANWRRVFPQEKELLTDLSDLIYSQDVPFGSTSIYAQYRVMKTAKEAGISVMLDGQGGDELFTGYNHYYHAYYREAMMNGDFDLLNDEQQYIDNTSLGNVRIKKLLLKSSMKDFLKKCLPKNIQDVLRLIVHRRKLNYLRFREKAYKTHPYTTLNQMLYTLMSYSSLPQLLKYEDRNSMRFSIETRTPFADDIDLIEYVFTIPGIYKIHHGWSKYLLRKSMDTIIPEAIIKRTDKIGFATPEYDWLQSIKHYVFDNINSDINAVLNIHQFEKNWEKNLFRQNKNGITEIWRYINFILWFKTFNVSI